MTQEDSFRQVPASCSLCMLIWVWPKSGHRKPQVSVHVSLLPRDRRFLVLTFDPRPNFAPGSTFVFCGLSPKNWAPEAIRSALEADPQEALAKAPDLGRSDGIFSADVGLVVDHSGVDPVIQGNPL